MGKRGSVPGSTAAKRAKPEQPKALVELPKPPKWLGRAARKNWRDLGRQLVEAGRMTALDGHLFAQLCHALAEIPRLESKIAETGDVVVTPNGAIQRHPYTVMLRETRNDVAKLSQRFGLSPADRARVPATKKPDDPDPMGKFF